MALPSSGPRRRDDAAACRSASPAPVARMPPYRDGHSAMTRTSAGRRGAAPPRHNAAGAGRLDHRRADAAGGVRYFTIPPSLLTQLEDPLSDLGRQFLRKAASGDLCDVSRWLPAADTPRRSDRRNQPGVLRSQALLVYLFCWLCPAGPDVRAGATFHRHHRHFPAAAGAGLVIWRLSAAQRKPLIWAIHLTILLNVVLAITNISPVTG